MQRAITAIYPTHASAAEVCSALRRLGVQDSSIQMIPDADDLPQTGSRDISTYNSRLHDLDLPEADVRTYQQAIRNGDYVVSVTVHDDSRLDEVKSAMRDPGHARDLDALDEEYRDAEYIPYHTGDEQIGSRNRGVREEWEDRGRYASGSGVGTDTEGTIPVVEEELHVGKRNVSHGGVRVRSYVYESPVKEEVELTDEHVEIERRPVNRAVSPGDDAFRERSIEAEERHEEAVISKEARVTEEIGIRRTAETHREKVSDTVRRTEVEVEDDRDDTERRSR
jgi:uncharacterized protein (TIGR02271 family)